MTKRNSFKELVRERMERTGESYSIAKMRIETSQDSGKSEAERTCCRCGTPIDSETFKYSEGHCGECANYIAAMGASPDYWNVD